MSDERPYDPILGGISVGAKGLLSGTLGAIVLDNETHAPLLLSNYHVLSEHESAKEIQQPYRPVGRVIALVKAGGKLDERVDAAVATLLGDVRYWASIEEIGPLTGIVEPEEKMHVRKRGRETGLTSGTIESVGATLPIPAGPTWQAVTMTNLVWIRGPFAAEGDSGAVLVDMKGRAVALLVAVGETRFGQKLAYATPISRVLTAMKARIALQGIGGYDLTSPADRVFAFDYEGTGTQTSNSR